MEECYVSISFSLLSPYPHPSHHQHQLQLFPSKGPISDMTLFDHLYEVMM